MAQKNETPLLVLSLLITISFLGGIGWWVFKSYDLSKFGNSTATPKNFTPQPESNLKTSSSLNNDLSSLPLTSTRGVDYTVLRQDLQRRNWKQANDDTTEALLKAFGSKSNQTGHVDVQEVANPPCADLKIIDQLWSKASNGNLGFTAQRQILRESGNDYRQAYNKMQWQRPGGEWLIQYIYDGHREKFRPGYEPNYGHSDKGHLPTFERGYNFQYSFDATLAKCGL
ncbi:hypothetical protein BV378_14810 [Nostoc sp. RF31YmG]|nr:hypothetical protein BV378_14810 [Nostoc sp. RF31YmG]